MPSTWTQMKSGERFTKVELDANSEEYKRIEQSARATSQNSLNQIIKVFSSIVIVQQLSKCGLGPCPSRGGLGWPCLPCEIL